MKGALATTEDERARANRLTIGICTRDRQSLLRGLLETLAPDAAAHDVEIIVADSASRKPARISIDAMAARGATVRLIRLERPGVSVARNAILDACLTPWLAFVDDDEIPRRGWLAAALALIDRLSDDCGACGGNVLPHWPAQPPVLSARAHRYLSLINHAGEFDQTAAPHFGIGHSIVRMRAMRDVGGFDTSLGRDGTTLLSGEESDLVEMLARRGWRVWHSDAVVVEHLIPPERLERSWLIDRAFWEGISVARRLARTPGAAERLVRVSQRRRGLLSPMVSLLGGAQDVDLRLAFVDGVLAEQALVGGKRNPAAMIARADPKQAEPADDHLAAGLVKSAS